RVKPYLQRLFEVIDPVVCVAACRVDGAHYREIDHIGKGQNAIKSQKTAFYWLFISTNKLCTDLSTERRKIRIVRGHNTALIRWLSRQFASHPLTSQLSLPLI
ncbi:hypothetical protein, partial [Aeromonas jandaei]|uniref:hypothetical protein n=1 Tax=Aeromonas jandaei TaxID=650 RepID=UPI003BA25880